MTVIRPREFLMIPGPTPVPDEVLEAHAKHPLGHRSQEFSQILAEAIDGLTWLAASDNEPLIITSSGTGAMDAAVANTVNRGDRVLSLVCGVFGERFARIATAYGAEVERLGAEAGTAIDPEKVDATLKKNAGIKAVTITHNETSTGVINDLEAIARVVRKHDALILVDAVTSFGAAPVEIDGWDLDVVVTGSQKALMLPPGLAFIYLSQRAWKAYESCTNGRFYLDLGRYLKSQKEKTTPFTPNVSLIRALTASLTMMKADGRESIFARHRKLREMLRKAIVEIGLKPFVEESCASPTITSILPPEDMTVPEIRQRLKDDYRIIVADGQEGLKGKIFRIGHMGYVFERDIAMTIAALQNVLNRRSSSSSTSESASVR
ncbi:MAG: alanine--glyoxylate aminotransferase family protein [Candidatus Obscuribacterales bacterium]